MNVTSHNPTELQDTLLRLAVPGADAHWLLVEVANIHPDASREMIALAAVRAEIEVAATDLEKARVLQDLAIRIRGIEAP